MAAISADLPDVRQVRATGTMRVIKYIQNELALELHQLDWLTNLSTF